MRASIVLLAICVLSQACNKTESDLTEAEKKEIITSTKKVVKEVFDYSNEMDFKTGLDHYSSGPESYFIMDGRMYNLAEVRQAYNDIGPAVEELQNTIEAWNIMILSRTIVTVTLPVKLKLKLKGLSEYTGQLIWTATLQKIEDKWVIVQSHESWQDCAEVSAALSPEEK